MAKFGFRHIGKAAVTFLELFGMSLRKVNARTIVQARIMATQAGLGKQLSPRVLEAHYLAGGDVPVSSGSYRSPSRWH